MKKIIIFIILLIFLTGCGVYDLFDFTTPNDAAFITCINELDTPEKIGDFMVGNIAYEIHDFYAPDPYTLWKTQKGDCNDMSIFGVFAADYNGYETWQIEIFDETWYQHYIAVYNEDIWYSITDCQYYYFGFNDFKEIVEDACQRRNKKWTKYIVYDYWNNIVEEKYND